MTRAVGDLSLRCDDRSFHDHARDVALETRGRVANEIVRRVRPARVGLVALVLLTSGSMSLFGDTEASKVVTAELIPPASRARYGAVIPLHWKLFHHKTGLLDGRLEIILDSEQQVVGRFYQDVVLSPGENVFGCMLPATGSTDPDGQLTVLATFRTADEEHILEEQVLNVSTNQKRAFVICDCAPRQQARNNAQRRLIDALRIDEFRPCQKDQSFLTASTNVTPADMPEHPMELCGYDLVVLHDTSLNTLRKKQLDTLLNWVESGGSLFVRPSAVADARRVEFLNRLVSAPTDAPEYMSLSDGKLLDRNGAALEAKSIRLVRKGLGRVAIVGSEIVVANRDSQADDLRRWRDLVGFLWKLREDQRATVSDTGEWVESDFDFVMQAMIGGRQVRERIDDESTRCTTFSPFNIVTVDTLIASLMPDDVTVLPLGWIGLILFAYILLIGPVDYFLLGWLRLRRLTWLTFPAVTFGITGFTLWLTHSYMMTSGDEKTLVVLDLNDEGAVSRVNRFEVLFLSRHREIVTDDWNGVVTRIDESRFRGMGARWGGYYGSPSSNQTKSVPVYTGRLPMRYSMAQDIPQWTPVLNRRFSIGEPTADDVPLPESDVDFDWSKPFEFPAPSSQPVGENDLIASFGSVAHKFAGSATLAGRIQEAFGDDAHAVLFFGGRRYLVFGRPILSANSSRSPYNMPQPNARMHFPGQLPSDFLTDICMRQPVGVFSVVSQAAPMGGDNFEDLPLLDPSNSNQCLLVIVDREGETTRIYRKLYNKDSE